MSVLFSRHAAVLMLLFLVASAALGQVEPATPPPVTPDQRESIPTPDRVEVSSQVGDPEIAKRLEGIYRATGWFDEVHVVTDEGVVFVDGVVDTQSHAQWSETLAQKTEGVVAVVNQLQLRERPVFDLSVSKANLAVLARDAMTMLPQLIVGLAVIALTLFVMRLVSRVAIWLLGPRIESQLLRQVFRSVVTVVVLVIGVYVALKVSGLSRLAVTLLGGTGLVGLAIGFAFRDIAENYLASILISMNSPFRVGDLVELEGYRGFVRRVTTRGTMLATLDGNHVQIPNNTVYKAIITNFSVSPRLRRQFTLGIGYDDSISRVQELILKSIQAHPATLADPKPMILVDAFGAATVNLRCDYWVDAERYDPLAVSSAVMRRVKQALIDGGVSMPDEAREVVFPNGVPVQMLEPSSTTVSSPVTAKIPQPVSEPTTETDLSTAKKTAAAAETSDFQDATEAEGNLQGNEESIQQDAAERVGPDSENLIA